MPVTPGEIERFRHLTREHQDGFINLQPIQRGGVLPPESKAALLSFGDGYSMCDFCLSGRLDEVEKPPVAEFLRLFAKFVDMDAAMPVGSSREGKRIVIQQLAAKARVPGKDPVVVIDGLAHYSTYLAAESAGARVVEVPHAGHPTYKLDADAYAATIDRLLDDSSVVPVAALLTHSDYLYGNVTDPAIVGRICKKKGIPFIVNGAYTVGIMPFSGKDVMADFVTASGHKSMAASGPIGMLACSSEHVDTVFPRSTIAGDWSGRSFGHKTLTLLGCPGVYGAPLATLMSSFPHVASRATPGAWQNELDNARHVTSQLERIEGVERLGASPQEHTLMQFETPSFEAAARHAPKKGFFLYNELKARGIVGLFPGMVKSMKLNTYGLSREQAEHVASSFVDIARHHGLSVG